MFRVPLTIKNPPPNYHHIPPTFQTASKATLTHSATLHSSQNTGLSNQARDAHAREDELNIQLPQNPSPLVLASSCQQLHL